MKNMLRSFPLMLIACLNLAHAAQGIAAEHRNAAAKLPVTGKRIMFLGDSNTHAGQYIVELEIAFRLALKRPPELINLGLPSETCCGLSEPDHPFPRPNVQERAKRAFEKVKPDVVVICYGMNDGIYHPFDAERFTAYKNGINALVQLAKQNQVQVVLMTPPAFDPLPMRKSGKLKAKDADSFAWFAIYENYDEEVMKPYADWIMTQNKEVDLVVDLHTPIRDFLAKKRESDPDFVASNDGVHFNNEGHEVVAQTILDALGIERGGTAATVEFRNIVKARQSVLHDAWLSHVGHLRPGVKPGLPLVQAQTVATQMEKQLQQMRP